MDEEYFKEMLKRQAKAIIMRVLENAKRYVEELMIKEGKGEYHIPNIKWVTSKEFTVTIGARQIEEYVSTWEFQDCWLHCLDYLSEEELEYQIHHHYRVRWSIPTRRKPIPRATASSYFIIEISKVKPPGFPVEVYFFFESNRLLHRTRSADQTEEPLFQVVPMLPGTVTWPIKIQREVAKRHHRKQNFIDGGSEFLGLSVYIFGRSQTIPN